ncbi:MAG: M28 family peptidase, partial [Phycisphaerales bacterium]
MPTLFVRTVLSAPCTLLAVLTAFAVQPVASADPGANSPALVQASPPTLSETLRALSVDEQVYHQHLVTLTNPFFEGRAPGLRGNALAQEYIEFYFKEKIGLQPFFPVSGATEDAEATRSFRQVFDAGRESVVTGQKLSFSSRGVNGAPRALVPGTDFNVLGMSGSTSAEGEVVFCGYAISEGPDDYSTFAKDDDLTGKIALVLRFEPKDAEGKSRFTKNGAWSPKAGLAQKLAAVRDRGAAGVLLVNPPGADDPRTNTLEDFRTLRGLQGSIPVVMVTIPQASTLCADGGASLEDLVKKADAQGGLTPLTGVRASMETKIERRGIQTANVAGVLRGRGELAEEYIIIGGHFDHLGYGYFGSRATSPAGKLHPGADDNASGTSGVLLSAQILAERYKALRDGDQARSIVFMCFSAEESGLIGSAYFVKNSPITAAQSYIMINMDMIGRLRNDKFDVGGGGTADGLCDIIDPIFAAAGLKVKTRNAEGVPFNGRGPSDHASFFRGGIPVLFLFTGLHPEYHTPLDTYPTVNVPGAVKVVGSVVEIASTLARRAQPLPFNGQTGQTLNPDYGQTQGKSLDQSAPRTPGTIKADPLPASAPPAAVAPAGSAPAAVPKDPHGGMAMTPDD